LFVGSFEIKVEKLALMCFLGRWVGINRIITIKAKITNSIKNHDLSGKGALINGNSAQTVLYFFLLM